MKPIAHSLFHDPGFVERAAEGTLLRQLIRPHFHHDHERLALLAFDEYDRLVAMTENDDGHQCCARLTPPMVRQIFSTATAAHLMIVHNHPSGEANPSRQDLELTQRLVASAKLLGLCVSDHLILTDAGHFSFRAAGLL